MATVNISGGVWSSLFLDQINSHSDQEGFFIGEVVSHVTSTVTDTQEKHNKEEMFINIHSYLPGLGLATFYDSKGSVDQVKLLSLLKDNYKNIIGWYTFRRMTPLQVSMKERTIHQSLLHVFHGISMNTFIFGMFTMSPNSLVSTYTMDFTFTTFNGSDFNTLPLTIVNLGDTENSDYKLSSNSTINTKTGVYSQILDSFREHCMDRTGQLKCIKDIQHMNCTLQSKLVSLRQKVGSSEDSLQKLSLEVQELRTKAEVKRKKVIKQKEEKKFEEQFVEENTKTIDTSPVAAETSCGICEEKAVVTVEAPVKKTLDSSDPFLGILTEMKASIIKSKKNPKLRKSIAEECDDGGEGQVFDMSSEDQVDRKTNNGHPYVPLDDVNDGDSDATFVSSQHSLKEDCGTSDSPVF
ncbi:BRISC complex subunit Abraxas 2-like [Saccoglossus kowalevskii]|uniref:BRISC complex subunit Abro1-like n=1 Tax=Saccoglossus kowalevskii TaxID=10224 RepID=A0ABM0MUW7_SACKO|nr:PREDICTED: BRISC complex subunit Abro1-like [Saccoglossus kowalevskii]